MKRTVWRRITAVSLASVMFIAGFVLLDPIQAFSSEYGSSSYGVSRGGREETALGISQNRKPALGMSGVLDALGQPIEVGNFDKLYEILNNKSGEFNIVLTGNIVMEKTIKILDNSVVVIDGQDKYEIRQNSGTKGFFAPQKNVDITLKNMDIYGYSYYGIIRGVGSLTKSYQVVTFENIYYRGPALYCGYTDKDTTCIIKSCVIDIVDTRDILSSSTEVNEAVEATHLIFDGGETVINFQIEGKKKSIYSLFWIQSSENKSGGMSLINDAHVTLNSSNYIIYTFDVKDAYLDIDDNCTLIVNSAAFNCDKTLVGYELTRVRIGENARLQYTQRGTPTYGPGSPQMRVNGDFLMEPGSVFLYDTEHKNGGFEFNNGTMTLNSPQLVSIYNPTAAFHKSGALGVKTGSWVVNDVDMVHYWRANAQNSIVANPANDLSQFSPEYSWMTKEQKRTFSFTGQFEFKSNAKNGVTWVSEELQNSSPTSSAIGTLKDVLMLNATAQRLVIGAPEGVVVIPEVLELVSVPNLLSFGTHELPAVTTIYAREDCNNIDEDGNMLVQIRDTRSTTSSPWTLTVALVETFSSEDSSAELSDTLVFINEGEKIPLSVEPINLYTPDSQANETDYALIWGEEEGLLAEVKPGAAQEGEYTAVLKWSLQVTP